MTKLIITAIAVFSVLITGCTAPRSILHSSEVTPAGKFRTGVSMDGNIPTQTLGAVYDGLSDGMEKLWNHYASPDTVPITADSLNSFVKALIAYSLDPVGASPGFFIRYGLCPRFDIGYRFTGGVHAFDVGWQFMGRLRSDTMHPTSPWNGSIAVQFSSQSYKVPSFAYLDKLQEILDYKLERKDILVPLVFGTPFGKKGEFGSFNIGAAYNLTFLNYGSSITKLVEKASDGSTKPFSQIQGEKIISAYGGFTNLKLGYRYVFLLGSFSIFRQDYGEYELFGGEIVSLGGLTFLPSLGLEFQF